MTGFGESKSIPLDRPKSQIFNSQSEFKRMLEGFFFFNFFKKQTKSRCKTLEVCMCLTALKI
jgi:hypothetical protein